MPQLNPEAGIPSIQLVQPETSREELLDIYLEVYKLHRLSSSPPGELAILQEVSSAAPDCPQEKEETLDVQPQPSPEDPTGKGRVQWTEVLPGCAKCTRKLCQPLQPWRRKSKSCIG